MPHLRSGVRGEPARPHRGDGAAGKLDHKDTELLRELKTRSHDERRGQVAPTPPPPTAASSAGCARPSPVAEALAEQPLFYVDALPGGRASRAVVDGDEGFHAATVRRIRPGERARARRRRRHRWPLRGRGRGKRGLSARVLDRWTCARPARRSPSCRRIPKAERSELAVELATEAGADDVRRLAGRPVRGPLGRPRPRRVCAAGVRWPGRRPGSRGAPTSRRSAARCRPPNLLTGASPTHRRWSCTNRRPTR